MRWYFNRQNKTEQKNARLRTHTTLNNNRHYRSGGRKEKWNDSAKEQEQRKSDTVYLPINITEKKKRPPPPILMSSSFDFIVRTKQRKKHKHQTELSHTIKAIKHNESS